MKLLMLLALEALISLQSFAGVSDRGGGMITRDQNNPWFVNNTKEVTYCINIDEQNMGLSFVQAHRVVTDVIAIWKENLEHVEYFKSDSTGGISTFKVATQKFTFSLCEEKTDLIFQFGELSPEQKSYFSDPKEFIGYAVRTDYDRAKMKGRGFVYIAPSTGLLKPNIETMPWTINTFKRVLLHEIGHVFGIQHNPNLLFMSEDFPQLAVNHRSGSELHFFIEKFFIDTFWEKPDVPLRESYCVFFFGAKECQIAFEKNKSGNEMLVFQTLSNSKQKLIGTVISLKKVAPPLNESIYSRSNTLYPLINLWIPKEFQDTGLEDTWKGTFISLVGYRHIFYNGIYVSADGKIKRPILFEVPPSGMQKIYVYTDGGLTLL